MLKFVKYLLKDLSAAGYTPQVSKTVMRVIDVVSFVKEHGIEYATSFEENAVLKIEVCPKTTYYLFYNMFTGKWSFVGFSDSKDNSWMPIETIFQDACSEA
jgi:hypothetical protein